MDLFDIAVARKLAGGGGGGGGAEIETGTWTPSAAGVTREFIPFANTHTSLPSIVILSVVQAASDSWSNNTLTSFAYIDYFKLWNGGHNILKTSGFGYSLVLNERWYNSASSTTWVTNITTHTSSETGDTDITYPRYFVSENGFYATSLNSSNSFPKPSSSKFHWIAIWT